MKQLRDNLDYMGASKTILSSDVLIMKVSVTSSELSRDFYCYYDDSEQEYFLCGGVRRGTDLNAEVFKFFCKSIDSLLSMLDSCIESSGERIELKLVNYPNLFVENEYIDYEVLDRKYKRFGFGYVSSHTANVSVAYNVDDDYNKVLCPLVIVEKSYNSYSDMAYFKMEKYAKLLKNVRW